MSLFAAIAALVWEYFQPLRPVAPRDRAIAWLTWFQEHFNAGGERHGVLAWSLGVLMPAIAVAVIGALLGGLWNGLAWLFDVLVLYFCLGYRHALARAEAVADAIDAGDLDNARRQLRDWRPGLVVAGDADGLTRQVLEETFRLSLIRMFGVLFWFFLLGVAGAVLYLLTGLAREHWRDAPGFGVCANRVTGWLDWPPARVTAFSFAIVGNFQDALEAWREQAPVWRAAFTTDPRDETAGNDGVLLAAGAAALGLRLGGDLSVDGEILVRPELGLDEPPEPGHLTLVAALIWRAALLWGAVLGLLWLGSL